MIETDQRSDLNWQNEVRENVGQQLLRMESPFCIFSFEELLELARNQQRQIENNETELDERRKAVALFGVAKRTASNELEQHQNARMWVEGGRGGETGEGGS